MVVLKGYRQTFFSLEKLDILFRFVSSQFDSLFSIFFDCLNVFSTIRSTGWFVIPFVLPFFFVFSIQFKSLFRGQF